MADIAILRTGLHPLAKAILDDQIQSREENITHAVVQSTLLATKLPNRSKATAVICLISGTSVAVAVIVPLIPQSSTEYSYAEGF